MSSRIEDVSIGETNQIVLKIVRNTKHKWFENGYIRKQIHWSKLSCREVWVTQVRVEGQSYPAGKCGWVNGELEVKAILQGSVDGSRESWRSKVSCR